MTKKLHKKIYNDTQGYYNFHIHSKGIYLQNNHNGSFTISDDNGNKETFYGYTKKDALRKFRADRRKLKD